MLHAFGELAAPCRDRVSRGVEIGGTVNPMAKKLSEMTLTELWHLFPIRLRPHDERWGGWFEEEKRALARALPPCRLHHIGSTAVKGIWAKPIVDLLAEMDPVDFPAAGGALLRLGWLCMSRTPLRCDYNKGYTGAGFAERVFHLHLRARGDNEELYFRDYLNDHPQAAREYEALKLRLWKRYEFDRDGYTRAKGEFIAALTAEAKRQYAGRY